MTYLDLLEDDRGPGYSKRMNDGDSQFGDRVSEFVKEIGQDFGKQKGKKL